MPATVEISFVDTDRSPAAEADIRGRIDKLERLYAGITTCRVFVAAPHQSQHKGNPYEVRVEVRVPGTELGVSNRPGDMNAHCDLHVAVRDAFNAMERQLKRWKETHGNAG